MAGVPGYSEDGDTPRSLLKALRAGKLFSKEEAPVLDAPVTDRATKTGTPRRTPGAPSLRRDQAEDFASSRVIAVGDTEDEVPGYVRSRRFSGLRFRLRGGVPKSVIGRIAGTCVLLAGLAGFTGLLWGARSALLHDPRLTIASSHSIEIIGNNHLTRPQLLSVFGEDVDRNILTVSLPERRRELESLPWVEHATVMRLLPNHIRVAINERTPVAFVREGGRIGLVDAKGVLLDLSPDVPSDAHYSFPVVTGISSQDPASVREARMELFSRFTGDLDGSGTNISKGLSEVDLSSPEDVKALIPSGSADVLVHFGDDDFLKRYHAFETNLPGWKASYPKLASVDMRYEHNVVLEMAPGAAVPVKEPDAASALPAFVKTPKAGAVKTDAVKTGAVKTGAVKTGAVKAGAVKPKVAVRAAKPAPAGGHLQQAYDVHAKSKAGPR